MSAGTHYDVLGAHRTATPEELKQAYRRALRRSHPDLGGSDESFRLVQAAWVTLSDAARRAEYDRLHMPQAAPPRDRTTNTSQGTRRDRHSARRGAGQTTTAPPTAQASFTFATSYGHPGGSSRAHYLDISRAWMASPGPPIPPPKPPRIRHDRDRFLQMWGVVCFQLFLPFVAIGAVLAAVAGANGTLPMVPPGAVFPTLRQAAIDIFGLAFLCGGAIATLRLFTSSARSEVRQTRARNRRLYESARSQFIDDVARRPRNPSDFLRAPFAPESVRMAPAHARAYLERAVAQEAIAHALKTLSADFTVWHDIRFGDAELYASHLLVGPQGLFLVEPLLERPRISAGYIERLTTALGVVGVSGVIFVDVDPGAVNATPAKLGERPIPAWRVGTAQLAPLLGGGIHGIGPGEPWEIRQLAERVTRRAEPA